jgi:hypothetical protein
VQSDEYSFNFSHTVRGLGVQGTRTVRASSDSG